MSKVNMARSRLANEVKKNKHKSTADVESVQRARAELAAAKLAQYIERVVSAAPPFTSEQLDRLALLLRPGGEVR